jgi:hypothetical protein
MNGCGIAASLRRRMTLKRANAWWRFFAEGVAPDRYVLYEGDRVVHEYVERRRR